MPVINPKGLRGLTGLRGWNNLSQKEQEAYLDSHPSLRGRSVRDVSNIYDNSQYVEEFGKDDFLAHPDKAWRDARLKHTIVGRTRDELWGNGFESLSDRENEAIKARLDGLTDDGFIDLVDTGKFLFPTESPKFDREAKMDKDFAEEKGAKSLLLVRPSKRNDWYELANPALSSLVKMVTPDGFTKNQNALDAVAARDDERKMASVSKLSSQIYDMFGQMSPSKFNDEFMKVFEGQNVRTGYGDNGIDYTTPGIGLYKTFKDHHELDNFSDADKKRFLANYYAMLQVYGPQAAEQATNSAMQNYIADNQTAKDWIGSAIRGIGGKTIASFGQLALGMQALGNVLSKASTEGWDAADKWAANFLQGKDENGDERAPIDNLSYWNGVDQYGILPIIDDVFGRGSASQIKEINENGSLSPYSWVSEADNPYSLAGATNEMLKMVGYMAAQVAIAHGVGVVGKTAARRVGGAFSEITGLYNSAMSTKAADIIMKYATPGVVSAINAVPISVGYAKSSFDEVLREATDRADYEAEKWAQDQYEGLERSINNDIVLTKSGFGVSEDAENPQEIAQIADEMNQWVVNRYNHLVKQGQDPSTIDVAQIYDDALANYKDYRRNQYLEDYKSGPVYRAMLEGAEKEAASAYERNATIEFLRMCGVNYLFKQWQQDKSVRAAMNSNYPNLETVSKDGQLAVSGKLFGRAVDPKLARWSQPVKTLWGGFESNYMDDVTAAYAKGFSLGRYNDYVNQLLDPEKNAATMSWMAGFTNAIAQAEGALTDKQSWYDGFIGAGGSGIVVAPGVSVRSLASKSGRTNWRDKFNYSQQQLAQMAGKYGLSIDEYINGEFERYVESVHPRWSEAQAAEEVNKIRSEDGLEAAVADGRIERTSVAERINRILYNPLLTQYGEAAEREREYKAIVDGGNKAIAEKKEAIEDMLRVVYAANKKGVADTTDSMFEGKEAKAHEAWALVSLLSRWMNDPVLQNSEFVQNSWAAVERMAKGESAITQQDIDNFYAATENRSEAERPDAADFAKKRLVSNAQQLVKMKQAYDEGMERTRNAKDFRVIAHHNAVDYVTEQLAYNQAMLNNRKERKAEMERDLQLSEGAYDVLAEYGYSKDNALESINQEIKDLEEVIASQEKYLKEGKRGRGESRTLFSLRRKGTELSIQEYKRQRNDLLDKKKQIESGNFDRVLSKEEILGLNHELQSKMFDPKNSRLYSKAQLAEIQDAIEELKTRDPNALEKIKDLATLENAIKDTQKSTVIMEDNMLAAADYFEYAARMRNDMMEDALVNHHYREVGKAVLEAKDDAERIAYAKTLSSETLERYLKDHPEHSDLLKGVKELVKLGDDIRVGISKAVTQKQQEVFERVREDGKEDTEEDTEAKRQEALLLMSKGNAIKETILGKIDAAGRLVEYGAFFNSRVQNEHDMMGEIEELADRSTDPDIRSLYYSLLEALEDAQHARNATIVEARRARKAAEERQIEHERQQDGKNFGWDGYRVGDKVWRKDGTDGTVQGFIAPAEGQSKGAITIKWNNSNESVTYTDDSQFSKTEPKDVTAQKATIDAQNAVNKVQSADYNIDKLDGIVAYEKAKERGAKVTADMEALINKAKQEFANEGIDYRVYLTPDQPSSTEEEILGEPLDSFTPDGGLITPTAQQEYDQALAETDSSPVDVPEQDAADRANNDEHREDRNYRADEGLLEGNALYEYHVDTLKNLGIVERRVPKETGDKLSNWFKWLDDNKIHLQEIVDRVVGRIYQKYPDTKIRFMISNDPMTSQQVIQVVEFTSDIETIYNKANEEFDGDLGGIVTATDGKEEKRYLIVGTTYSHIGIGFYNMIGNPLKSYIKANSKTPFYVHPTIYSKIAKMDAGRLIRQQVGESEIKYRRLSELFSDKLRNPNGIDFENAILGIVYNKLQSGRYFLPNKTAPGLMFPPGKNDSILGNVFLMIPATNGNYIPINLKTDMYLNSSDLVEGSLTADIDYFLRQMTSKDLAERKRAISQLSRLVHFDSEGGKVINGILVGSETVNNISLILNGEKVQSWNLDDPNFIAKDFIDTIKGTSFRINVAQWMLNDIDMLKSLDEAGVLKTDVSTLRTGNTAYQIYPVDSEGKPADVKVRQAVPDTTKVKPSRADTSTKPIGGVKYRMITIDGKTTYVTESGQEVEDPALKTSIYYNLYIQKWGLKPSYTSGETGLRYYTIVNNPSNPTIVSIDENRNVKVLSTQRAKQLLGIIAQQEEAAKKRLEAAEELKRIEEGKQEVDGELIDDEPPVAPQQPAQPKQPVFIEPKHNSNVEYGPAITVLNIHSKFDRKNIDVEVHVKVTTDDAGNKKTKLAGWDSRGLEWGIPWNAKTRGSLEVPDGYAIPEGPVKEQFMEISELEELTDGTVRANIRYGNNNSWSYGWITLEKQDQPKPQQPQQQEPQSQQTPTEEKPSVPEVDYDPNKATSKSLRDLEAEKKTPTFDMLFLNREDELVEIADEKGWDLPEDVDDAWNFIVGKFKEHNKEVPPRDAINDPDTFINNLRSCY